MTSVKYIQNSVAQDLNTRTRDSDMVALSLTMVLHPSVTFFFALIKYATVTYCTVLDSAIFTLPKGRT